MATPHFPTLDSGRKFAAYTLGAPHQNDVIVDEFDSGAVGSRERWSRTRREFRLVGRYFAERDISQIMGFIRDEISNGADFFYWDNLVHNVWDPGAAPTLGQSAGGALGGRTYYVTYTWSDGDGETRDSTEASYTVDANKYLTVQVPRFPTSVTQAKIYIGTVTDTLYYSGLLSTDGGTWTEDDTATTVDADSNSGQKVLNVAATAGFQVGSTVIVHDGGAREEVCVIASIQAGVSLTMEENLTYTHTLGDADPVATVVGESTQDTPPTSNNLDEELKVLLIGNPEPELVSGQANSSSALYNLELTVRELLT